MPKSALTGTQKKELKESYHEKREARPLRKKATKKTASYLHGGGRAKKTEKDLESIRKEQKKGTPGTAALKKYGIDGKAFKGSEDLKGLKPFEYKGKSYQKPDFSKDLSQGYDLARHQLKDIQKQELQRYGQITIPGISSSLGSESSQSSALNQAMAAADKQLKESLYAQTAGLATQYGGDIGRMNLGERARQQELQQQTAVQKAGLNIGQQQHQQNLGYQSAADVYKAKYGANQDYANQQRANREYINNLNLGAASQLQNAGIPGTQGLYQQAYLQKGQSGPSALATLGAGAIQAAGTAAGAYLGGPGGAVAGNKLASWGTNQLGWGG